MLRAERSLAVLAGGTPALAKQPAPESPDGLNLLHDRHPLFTAIRQLGRLLTLIVMVSKPLTKVRIAKMRRVLLVTLAELLGGRALAVG